MITKLVITLPNNEMYKLIHEKITNKTLRNWKYNKLKPLLKCTRNTNRRSWTQGQQLQSIWLGLCPRCCRAFFICCSQSSVEELVINPFYRAGHSLLTHCWPWMCYGQTGDSEWSVRRCFHLVFSSWFSFWKTSSHPLPDDLLNDSSSSPQKRRQGEPLLHLSLPPPTLTCTSPELTLCFQVRKMKSLCPLDRSF